MKNIHNFYSSNIEIQNGILNKLKQKIYIIGTLRLLVFIVACVVCYFIRSMDWRIILSVILLFLSVFLILLRNSAVLAKKREYRENLIILCCSELKALNYDFSDFDGCRENIDTEHPFSFDLDIFGEGSVMQSLNRTVTSMGRNRLTERFLTPFGDKRDILLTQDAVKELSKDWDTLGDFYSKGKMGGKTGEADSEVVEKLISSENYFINKPVWKILTITLPIILFTLLILLILGVIQPGYFAIGIIISFMVAYLPYKKIAKGYSVVNKMGKIFDTYSELLKTMEQGRFSSELLSTLSGSLNASASTHIKKISKLIGALDQSGSLMGILLNVFTLRDIRTVMKIERWREKNRDYVIAWFDVLGEFDSLVSLALFSFNHPSYIYPEVGENYFTMRGKALGHPLIDEKVCVKNDINMDKSPDFMIVTGANMAGKSTYLRTVGVNFLLASMGAPVFAESLTFYPANLYTSLRTSDSLIKNESYFFAELKRLKRIIDKLKGGGKLFIILDEILKGTNSVDKQKGSLALIKQFIRYNSCGIVATHDLVLGTLASQFPECIRNYRFEADISGDTLSFSYKLQEGIAENMNATWLMEKMEIINN